jgi:hypothetical protein
VYKLNRRVTIKRYGTAKNEFGGLDAVLIAEWSKWAEVRERTGSNLNERQQGQWEYDQIFILRYEKERPTRSNDVLYYEAEPYKITSVQIRNEGAKSWEYIQAVKIDEQINNDAPMDTGNIQVYNYIAMGGEFEFTDAALIGKTVFAAFKDGVQYLVRDVAPTGGKEVYFNSTTGEFVWSVYFEAGEVATILYY